MSSFKGDLIRNAVRQLGSMAEKLSATAGNFEGVDMLYASELEQLVERIEKLRHEMQGERRKRHK